MKLRKRTIWAVALGMSACIAVAHADKPPRHRHSHGATKPAAPIVQLPQDAERVAVVTPLGGPTVTLPVRGGVDVATTAPAAPVAMATTSAPRVSSPRIEMPVVTTAPTVAPKVALPPGDISRVRTTEAGPVVYLPQQ